MAATAKRSLVIHLDGVPIAPSCRSTSSGVDIEGNEQTDREDCRNVCNRDAGTRLDGLGVSPPVGWHLGSTFLA